MFGNITRGSGGESGSTLEDGSSGVSPGHNDTEEEIVVRDLDMGRLAEIRDLWAFYRDRRPDSYESLTKA